MAQLKLKIGLIPLLAVLAITTPARGQFFLSPEQ